MRLVFFINYLNSHQVYLMDEFYTLLGDSFHCITTLPRSSEELKGGADFSTRPYCILATESITNREYALRMAREAEVCVFGACSQEYANERTRFGRKGLSFEMGERWLKRGLINVLSPTFRRWYVNYLKYYRHHPFYKLCCSAYTAPDDLRLHVYKGRHYKWGYFTQVSPFDDDRPLCENSPRTISIMWCARFLKWKHPELVIELARKLKDRGYYVHFEMYGDGPERKSTECLCSQLGVQKMVSFKGSLPNEMILQAMRNSDIFLFTSDKNEGWGAVLNEAMSSRCAVVSSDAVGAAPFLIRDGENGFLFRSERLQSLYEKVIYLLDNSEIRNKVAERGYQDMLHVWSPRSAARNLIQLIDDLEAGREPTVQQGPCSKA